MNNEFEELASLRKLESYFSGTVFTAYGDKEEFKSFIELANRFKETADWLISNKEVLDDE